MTALAIAAWMGLVALAAPPGADGLTPIRVTLDAPSGCGDVDAFYASVLSRTDRARRADPGEPAVRLEVRLTRVGSNVHGELRLLDEEGHSDLRRVDGATCDEVAAALSLPASLALVSPVRATPRPTQATPSSGAGAAPPPPSTPSPPPASTPAPVAAPPVSSMSPPVTVPPPTDTTRPPERARPEPEVDAPVAKVAAAVPPDARPGSFHLQIAAGPAIGRIISPGLTVGGALSSRIARAADPGLAPSLGLALVHLRNDVIVPSQDVIVTWTALAATVCPGWGLRDRVTIEACGLGLAGWLTAADVGVNVRNAIGRVWLGAGIDLRAAASVGGGFELQADAALHIPFITRRFITTTPAAMVGESSRVAGMLGVSLAHSL